MVRRRHWLLAVVALGVIWIHGCDEEQLSKVALKAQYHYTAECTYCDIRVDGSKITYTYFKADRERCDRWLVQAPCWTQNDFKTATASLSDSERRNLASLIAQSGFMDLKDTYGEEHESARYYPYTLEVTVGEQVRRVEYRSRPDAPPMPEAFVKVRDRLLELAEGIADG